MKVNFNHYFKNNLMVGTNSNVLVMEEIPMEYEVSIVINIDVCQVLDIIFLMIILYLL